MVTAGHGDKIIELFSIMGATQQGTDIFRRMEAAWQHSVANATGTPIATPMMPTAVGDPVGTSGSKRNPKAAAASDPLSQPPANQRVLQSQPTQQTQYTAPMQPARQSQVDEALAATAAIAAAKAAAKAHPGRQGPQREVDVSPTVDMSDGAAKKRSGKTGKHRDELKGRDLERAKALARIDSKKSGDQEAGREVARA